ncbi:proteasome accessory factor PafA2 family protein [Patescibacteria group bacterium AH-259-L07]|nr:proteasome accessory factor PafA2 family protein [Patescibacteria group bacterium AH-259-L07]
MKKRLYGIESEYRFVAHPPMNPLFIRQCIGNAPDTHNCFMLNGGRLYIDEDMVEFATPECTSVIELIKYENAGNQIVFDKLKGYAEVLKSSQGWIRGSNGCHENYLIERRLLNKPKNPNSSEPDPTVLQPLAKRLTAFFVSKPLLCGAGAIRKRKDEPAKYHISQRAISIRKVLGVKSKKDRPLIHFREESHTTDQYFRFHIISGDNNMSEISRFLKVSTTGFLLRMVEAGWLNNAPQLATPIAALQTISADPTCKALVRLTNGQQVTGINLQEMYLHNALKFAENVSLSNEEKLGLKIWADTTDKLKRDPRECDQELDWRIKQSAVEEQQEQTGLPLDHEDVDGIAYLYHQLNPEKSIYFRLRKNGHVKQLVTDDEVNAIKHVAPSDNRVHLRAKVIKTVLKHRMSYGRYVKARWGEILYSSPFTKEEQCISILEPFETENDKIDWLITQIENDTRLIGK